MCSLLFLLPFFWEGTSLRCHDVCGWPRRGRTCAHSPFNTAHVPMQCAPDGLEDACDLDVAIWCLSWVVFIPWEHGLSLLSWHDCCFNLSAVSPVDAGLLLMWCSSLLWGRFLLALLGTGQDSEAVLNQRKEVRPLMVTNRVLKSKKKMRSVWLIDVGASCTR